MHRIKTLLAMLLTLMALALAPFGVGAREPDKPVRVGWLSSGNMETMRPLVDAFRQGMSELGHVEGKSYSIDFHWGADTIKSYTWMARDMMREHPDVIVATCGYTSGAAVKVTGDVPVVVTGGADLVSLGFAKSLSRPGGNVTGLTSLSPEIAAKRLELLKETVPRATRIAVLNDPDDSTGRQAMAELTRAANTLGVELLIFNADSKSDYAKIFDDIRAAKVDAFLMLPASTLFFNKRRDLVALALNARLPSSFTTYEYVEEGGMMSFGIDYRALFRRTAIYIDKIVKGANPADLPIEQPTRFELAVNQKTARALGVAIPPSVLLRADRVIE